MPDTEETWAPTETSIPKQSPLDAELSAIGAENWSTFNPEDLALVLVLPEEEQSKEVPASEIHRRAIYLSALRRSGSRLVARRAAGATKTDMLRWASDLRFRDAEVDALRDTGELVIARAVQLGVEGTLEPIFQGGVCVGHKRKFSEKILIKLLEGFAKGRFGKEFASKVTTNNTVITTSPEAIAEIVRRLGPRRVEHDIEAETVAERQPSANWTQATE